MISDYFGNKMLDDTFITQATRVSLHTATPGRTGANEVAGGSYARQAVSWDAAASRATANSIAVLFSGMPTCTVTHFGFWDTASPPNFLGGKAVDTPRAFTAGDNANFNIGEIDTTIEMGD